MATAPAFTSTARTGSGQVTVANTNRDGTGTLVAILTRVTAGTRMFEVDVQARQQHLHLRDDRGHVRDELVYEFVDRGPVGTCWVRPQTYRQRSSPPD